MGNMVQLLPQPAFLFLQAVVLVEIAGGLCTPTLFLNGTDLGADLDLCLYSPLEVVIISFHGNLPALRRC